jgi:hypothetical protein
LAVEIPMAVVFSIPGWWYTYPSEKYEFVSWDDDFQYMEKIKNDKKCIKTFQTTNQILVGTTSRPSTASFCLMESPWSRQHRCRSVPSAPVAPQRQALQTPPPGDEDHRQTSPVGMGRMAPN